MRTGLGLLLLACMAQGQILVDPVRVPRQLRNLEPEPGEQKLTCRVREILPSLNFGFNFQSGWTLSVPTKQYTGSFHRWSVVTRITPEGGEPVYLTSSLRLPQVPKGGSELDVSGSYLLGEGRYGVLWKLVDDSGRVCHAHWKVEARRSRSESKVRVAMQPGTVSDLSRRRVPSAPNPDDAKPFRVTLMFHAAPVTPRRIPRMSGRDRVVMLGILSSLLERLPTSAVRLVVFNLDRQAELLREEKMGPGSLGRVGRVMNELEIGTVDFQTLSNRKGHVDLLADLINRELAEAEPSDVVLFVGPAARFFDKVPGDLVDKAPSATPGFFYLQYRPPFRREPVFNDSIGSAVTRVGGKVKVVRTPGEFAKAIDEVERRAAESAIP